jgi:ABC-type glycerol-3-phosphate transport system permease component
MFAQVGTGVIDSIEKTIETANINIVGAIVVFGILVVLVIIFVVSRYLVRP